MLVPIKTSNDCWFWITFSAGSALIWKKNVKEVGECPLKSSLESWMGFQTSWCYTKSWIKNKYQNPYFGRTKTYIVSNRPFPCCFFEIPFVWHKLLGPPLRTSAEAWILHGTNPGPWEGCIPTSGLTGVNILLIWGESNDTNPEIHDNLW